MTSENKDTTQRYTFHLVCIINREEEVEDFDDFETILQILGDLDFEEEEEDETPEGSEVEMGDTHISHDEDRISEPESWDSASASHEEIPPMSQPKSDSIKPPTVHANSKRKGKDRSRKVKLTVFDNTFEEADRRSSLSDASSRQARSSSGSRRRKETLPSGKIASTKQNVPETVVPSEKRENTIDSQSTCTNSSSSAARHSEHTSKYSSQHSRDSCNSSAGRDNVSTTCSGCGSSIPASSSSSDSVSLSNCSYASSNNLQVTLESLARDGTPRRTDSSTGTTTGSSQSHWNSDSVTAGRTQQTGTARHGHGRNLPRIVRNKAERYCTCCICHSYYLR